ncbi:hypothetical protein TNCV_2548591 [Trichonephila clavipes]|nr:hypothetical protein TNCV_2548591 [Trichonephila clavipes]
MELNGRFLNIDPDGSRHLQSIFRCSWMNGFKRRTTEMLIVFGEADYNGHSARQLHQERYPNTRVPHHTSFASVNGRLRETR